MGVAASDPNANDDHARLMRGYGPFAGKYRVERILGQGGMGTVFEARHIRLGQRVAIKVLGSSLREYPELVQRFEREARAASALRSANAVRVFDIDFTEDGTPFIVMELLTGVDLARIIDRDGAQRVSRAVRWVLQASDAIIEAHALGIVHRDLKPSNLFLTSAGGRGLVKVLDFGIAKRITSHEVAITQAVVPLGTPQYMSPEQVRCAKDVDARTDIWSLGVSLYELVTGQTPFPYESSSACIAAIAADDVPDPRTLRLGLSDAFAKVLMTALEKNPAHRYPTVEAFALALAPFAEEEEGTSSGVRDRLPVRSSAPSGAEAHTVGAFPSGSQRVAPVVRESNSDAYDDDAALLAAGWDAPSPARRRDDVAAVDAPAGLASASGRRPAHGAGGVVDAEGALLHGAHGVVSGRPQSHDQVTHLSDGFGREGVKRTRTALRTSLAVGAVVVLGVAGLAFGPRLLDNGSSDRDATHTTTTTTQAAATPEATAAAGANAPEPTQAASSEGAGAQLGAASSAAAAEATAKGAAQAALTKAASEIEEEQRAASPTRGQGRPSAGRPVAGGDPRAATRGVTKSPARAPSAAHTTQVGSPTEDPKPVHGGLAPAATSASAPGGNAAGSPRTVHGGLSNPGF